MAFEGDLPKQVQLRRPIVAKHFVLCVEDAVYCFFVIICCYTVLVAFCLVVTRRGKL